MEAVDNTASIPLQGKIQKQQAFEAEIAANRSQVDNVIQTAIRLNDSGHFAAEHITGRVEQLSELWDSLCEAARVKTERLGEAWKAQQLNRAIEDVMVWIETTASSLVSEEHVGYIHMVPLIFFRCSVFNWQLCVPY